MAASQCLRGHAPFVLYNIIHCYIPQGCEYTYTYTFGSWHWLSTSPTQKEVEHFQYHVETGAHYLSAVHTCRHSLPSLHTLDSLHTIIQWLPRTICSWNWDEELCCDHSDLLVVSHDGFQLPNTDSSPPPWDYQFFLCIGHEMWPNLLHPKGSWGGTKALHKFFPLCLGSVVCQCPVPERERVMSCDLLNTCYCVFVFVGISVAPAHTGLLCLTLW